MRNRIGSFCAMGGQPDVVVLVAVGRGGVVGDAEDPGQVADGVVQQVVGALEGARGDDGEHAAEQAATAAPAQQSARLVERLLRVLQDAARRPLVQVGARRLPEHGGHAGLEVLALLPASLRLLRPLDHLLRQLDRPRQRRPQVVHP
jgi:hypothetical protein